MKYIKTYEIVIFKDELPLLKKYVVWEMSSCLIILEVENVSDIGTSFSRRFFYNTDYNILTPDDKEPIFRFFFNNDDIKKRCIYTSDNLHELINILPTLKDANKYNL